QRQRQSGQMLLAAGRCWALLDCQLRHRRRLGHQRWAIATTQLPDALAVPFLREPWPRANRMNFVWRRGSVQTNWGLYKFPTKEAQRTNDRLAFHPRGGTLA